MQILSWNVNGIRAVMRKGKLAPLAAWGADVIAVQETKAQPEQARDLVAEHLPDYPHQLWHSAERKGYSGTAMFCRREPLAVRYGLEAPEHHGEGRVLTAEFPELFVVTVYSPNSKRDLSRLPDRQRFDAALLRYVRSLEASKPVVFCGDLNVAHTPIDLARPKDNEGHHGFTAEERRGFQNVLDAGFLDSFRHQHPGVEGCYTWWAQRRGVRERNVGWRLDYVVASGSLAPALGTAAIHPDHWGSDHCPVSLTLEL